MRGLQPTGDVDRRTIDRAELTTEIEKLYRAETPPELVAARERFYKALDLLPADASLDDLEIEMLSAGVAGYYRDDQKRLYVVSTSGNVGATEKITFAHEFNHVLQFATDFTEPTLPIWEATASVCAIAEPTRRPRGGRPRHLSIMASMPSRGRWNI